MTNEQIEAILDRVRDWPPEQKERAAEVLLIIEEQEQEEYELSDEERAEIEIGEAEAERGEFATDEEMKTLFDRYRLL